MGIGDCAQSPIPIIINFKYKYIIYKIIFILKRYYNITKNYVNKKIFK